MASEKTKQKIKQAKESEYLVRLHLIEELINISGGNPGSIGRNVKTTKKNGKRITRYYPLYQASIKIDPDKEPYDVKLRIRAEDVKAVNAMIEDAKERNADEIAKREHDFKDWELRKDKNIDRLANVRSRIEGEEREKSRLAKKKSK